MIKKTYHIITIGCQMNKSDSERIAAIFEELGFEWEGNKYKAEYVVLVTCGIRQSAEDRVYGFVPRIKKENPAVKIILTGCLENREDVRKRMKDGVDFWLPIVDLYKLPIILGESNSYLEKEYLKNKAKINSSFSAFVPIGNGCDNFCSYCVVPYARGREKYRSCVDIVNEVKNLVDNGYKEITLIAQNVNSYKFEKENINFAKLLKMVDAIEGDFWIRFATSHPKDMSDDLIDVAANCKKVCHHIHLPIQSGNNKVLAEMNRKYTVEHYKKLIDKIKKKISNIAITTDIIVGFPGETKEEFQDTYHIFEYVGYDMAYVAQYSPRPGTAAYQLDDNVRSEEKKKREFELMNILRKTALKNNEKYLGKLIKVLIEGKDKNDFWYGKNQQFKNVKIVSGNKNNEDLTGKFVKVQIDEVKDFGLKGLMI